MSNPLGRSIVVLCALLALSGCARLSALLESPEPEPVVVSEPAPEPEPEPQVLLPEPKPLPEPAEPASIPPLAIVLTSREPAYAEVANALTAKLDRYDLYDLNDASRPPVSVLRSVNDSNSSAVIAIGLRAARSSVMMADAPVVFSQVFNYGQHELLTGTSRGVAALPPVRAQFAAWQAQNPDLERIGTIVGGGHEALLDEAELAAQELGLELRVHIAQSDQETLFLFRRMIRDIDGYWLLPDNRILSRRALEEMLRDAERLNVPVAVPSESMLVMGATISLSSVAEDIAATILDVVRKIEVGGIAELPDITPLTEVRATTRASSQVADP